MTCQTYVKEAKTDSILIEKSSLSFNVLCVQLAGIGLLFGQGKCAVSLKHISAAALLEHHQHGRMMDPTKQKFKNKTRDS